ncbi:hypothetical protein NM208_g7438 [Fusarium decemcellulare]|uniref:Uncharacterized protein n=1 Tax=Fusarium decemcellulare TaxID=57161 RepID=A0ACC1S959_9HYPO|nr:hypothetical protein NM208_g7438 [Fusarium decemcellulare]
MSQGKAKQIRRNSFVSDFLGENVTSAPPAHSGQTAIAKDNARQIVGNIINNYFELPEDREVNRKWLQIIEWLTPSKEVLQTQALVHRDARQSQFEGTGTWFLDSPEFQQWLYGSDTLLWVHGIVGCGKTVLFSTAVENTREACRSDPIKLSAFFYCTSRDPSSQDIDVLLRLLLIQLSPPPTVCEPLEDLYNLCNETFPPKLPTVTELAKTLTLILEQPALPGSRGCQASAVNQPACERAIYILIDGLDEVPWSSRSCFLQLTSNLAALDLHRVHLLITSRNQPDIQEAMSEPIAWAHITIEDSLVQEDINRYVSYTINLDRRLRRLPEKTKDAIKTRVGDEGKGMFLWASLQLKALVRLRVILSHSILEALKSLPRDLDETYYRILGEIDSSLVPQASSALKWLALSTRPLYVEELADACSIDLQLSPVLGERLDPYIIFEILHDLISIQPPLAGPDESLIPRKHRISLFHASVGEFLKGIETYGPPSFSPRMSDFRLEDDEAHLHIAQSCLAYLYYYNIASARDNRFDLCDYAFYNWDKHLDHMENQTEKDSNHTDAGVRRKAMSLYNDICDLHSPKTIIQRATGWLPDHDVSRLLEAVNLPAFHANFDSFFLPSDRVAIASRPSGVEAKPWSPDVVRAPYHPLKFSRNEVRFLELLPCLDSTTETRSRMYTASLDHHPPRYVALSYTWGMPIMENPVFIDGFEVKVTSAQAQLLRVLRSRGEDSLAAIWMDAICIDHYNLKEKEYQIALMDRIFAGAQHVIVGLGEEISSDEQGIRVLSGLAALLSHRLESKPSSVLFNSEDLAAMMALFRGHWWHRAWMIQEIVLSSNAIMLIGSLSCNFNLIGQVMDAELELQKFFDSPGRSDLFLLRNHPEWLAAKRLVQTRSQWAMTRGLPLPALLWRFRNSACLDPRDKVNSLLSICRKEDTHALSPDYNKETHVFFREVSAHIMSAYNCLDILSLRCAWTKDSLPASWALELQHLSETMPLILGIFEWPRQPEIYTACGTHGYWASIPSDYRSGSTLHVKGQCFDTVRRVLNRGCAPLKRICRRISSIEDQTVYAAESQIEIRWRTLFADQWPVGQRLGKNTSRGAPIPTCPQDESRLLEQPGVRKYTPFLQGRSTFLTTGGYLGLGPQGARPGDEVAVLAGGAVLYILRKQGSAHVLIGDCYVHDCMDGEVISRISQDREDIDSWAQIIKIVGFYWDIIGETRARK